MAKPRHERPVVTDHGRIFSIIRMGDSRDSIADTSFASCEGDRDNGEWWADRISLLPNFAVGLTNEQLAELSYNSSLADLVPKEEQ